MYVCMYVCMYVSNGNDSFIDFFTFSNHVLIDAACMVSRCEALKTKSDAVAYNPERNRRKKYLKKIFKTEKKLLFQRTTQKNILFGPQNTLKT